MDMDNIIVKDDGISVEFLCFELAELSDLVAEAISHTGPVNLPSWQYPKENLSTIDVTEKFSSCVRNKSPNQQHILVLGLIVDRLVLLLNLVILQLKNCIVKLRGQVLSPKTPNNPTNRPCILTVAKECWSTVCSISNCGVNLKKSAGNELFHIVTETRNSRSQTDAIFECNRCDSAGSWVCKMQQAIIQACEALRIPSVVAGHKERGTVGGVNFFLQLAEVLADMEMVVEHSARLHRSLDDMRREATNECRRNLESERAAWKEQRQMMEEEMDQLRNQLGNVTEKMTSLESENRQQREAERELNEKMQRCTLKEKEQNAGMADLQELLLEKDKEYMELRSSVRDLLTQKEQEIEEIIKNREKEVEEMTSNLRGMAESAKAAEEERKRLTDEGEDLRKELDRLRNIIEEEQARTRSESSRLLSRVDDLKGDLERIARECSNRESYLVNFPDLVSPPEAQPNGDDVIEDMKSQFRSNTIRIEVLTEHNEKLESAIAKLTQMDAATLGKAKQLNLSHFNP